MKILLSALVLSLVLIGAIVGCAIGAALGDSYLSALFSSLCGMVAGGIAGYLLVRRSWNFERRSEQYMAATTRILDPKIIGKVATLDAHVMTLELEIQALKQQLEQQRQDTFTAPHTANAPQEEKPPAQAIEIEPAEPVIVVAPAVLSKAEEIWVPDAPEKIQSAMTAASMPSGPMQQQVEPEQLTTAESHPPESVAPAPLPAFAVASTSMISVPVPAIPAETPPAAKPQTPQQTQPALAKKINWSRDFNWHYDEIRADKASPPPSDVQTGSWVRQAFQIAYNWLLGGNTVVHVGVIVLLFGVAFLLKYTAGRSMMPAEFRLAGAAVGAVAMLVVGWHVGRKRAAYGLVLQGGGVGVLYLTVFAAIRLYHLIPAGAALAMMVAVCALSAYLAIRQDASPLAFMGSAGGFLAPVLLASNGGSHVALFTYYALLNAGIFAIAWFKAWRPLNLLGFVFTFVICSAWGVTNYRPALLVSTEPFLVLFFLMYTGIALLYAVRHGITLKHYVDSTLVFGTPIVVMGLQTALIRNIPFGMAFSAVALSAFYLAMAGWLKPRRARLGLLFDAMLAIAVLFATLALPLAFSGSITGAAWALEGAAIVWAGVREKRLARFCFGLAMQVAAAGAFWVQTLHLADLFQGGINALVLMPPGSVYPVAWPVLNSAYLATLLIALAGIFTGWWLHGRNEARAWFAWMPDWGLIAALWGLLWWLGGGLYEIYIHTYQWTIVNGVHIGTYAGDYFALIAMLFIVVTAWLSMALRRKLAWPLAQWPALALTPALTLFVIVAFSAGHAPLTGFGALVWPLTIVLAYLLLWHEQRDVGDRLLAPLHMLMFWNLASLLTLEGYWRLSAYVPEGAWSWSAWAYGFGLLLLLVSRADKLLRWPVARFAQAYQVWGALPLAAMLWGWSIASVLSDGSAAPLFWLPLLNPLDVAQMLIVIAAAVWWRRLRALDVPWLSTRNSAGGHWSGIDYLALATGFLWYNALLLRVLHHWFHVVYNLDVVFTSFNWQMVFLAAWCALLAASLWRVQRKPLVQRCLVAAVPLLVLMWLWTLHANFVHDGGRWASVPLLNPFDLVQLAIYGVIALWFVRLKRLGIQWLSGGADGANATNAKKAESYRSGIAYLALATGFVWFNAMLLRTLHRRFSVSYSFGAIFASFNLQQIFLAAWCVLIFAGLWWARREHFSRRCTIAAMPLIAVMWLWTLYINFMSDGGHWAHVPLFNPLDLVQLAVYGVAVLWFVRARRLCLTSTRLQPVATFVDKAHLPLLVCVSATLFIWLNAMLLRTLSHWTHVPYALDALMGSMLVQAALSVFWTAVGLTTMVFATRRMLRLLWFVGIALLGLTVVKLFLFDLSHVQGLMRVVSFIGTGVLLLLAGYFSPLPPRMVQKTDYGQERTA